MTMTLLQRSTSRNPMIYGLRNGMSSKMTDKLHTLLDRARNWLLLATVIAIVAECNKVAFGIIVGFFLTLIVDTFFVLRDIRKRS